jgi:hypothetical protein
MAGTIVQKPFLRRKAISPQAFQMGIVAFPGLKIQKKLIFPSNFLEKLVNKAHKLYRQIVTAPDVLHD